MQDLALEKKPVPIRAASSACPVCGGSRAALFFRCLTHVLLQRCPDCGHFFVETSAFPPGYLDALYQDHYSGFRSDPVFERVVRSFVRDELGPRVRPKAHLLDVGCGNGAFMSAAREHGYVCEGLDTSKSAVEMCQRNGLDVTFGDLSAIPGSNRYDVITMWDVIEHVEAPHSLFKQVLALLNDDGLLFLKTPLVPKRAVRLVRGVPRLAGSLLSLPAHVQLFRPETLRAVLLRAGFSSVEVTTIGSTRGKPEGGGVPKQVKRAAVRVLHRSLGSANLVAFARKGRAAEVART